MRIRRGWHFEAGAMSVNKGIGKQHVAPVLLGLRKPQLTGPLTQFQSLSDARTAAMNSTGSLPSARAVPLREVQEKLF
jgi:hypothetical protein